MTFVNKTLGCWAAFRSFAVPPEPTSDSVGNRILRTYGIGRKTHENFALAPKRDKLRHLSRRRSPDDRRNSLLAALCCITQRRDDG